MKLDALTESVGRLGWKIKLLRYGDRAAVAVLERGGRIIGIYPDTEQGNAAWTNPALYDCDAARKMFEQEKHCHIGGERTWFSPELEYNVEEPGPPASYTVQQTIDPGGYTFVELGGAQAQVGLKMAGRARLFRLGRDIGFSLSKTCRLIDDPLRHTAYGSKASYRYVGYETEVDLEADGEGGELPLSSWTILQVPAGGQAFAPVYGLARPTDFFAATGSSHLAVEEGLVRFRMDGKQAHKISLTNVQTTGRFGYFRQDASGHCSLIVRQIGVFPSSAYLDVPWHDPLDRGHCVQMYNDDGQIGAFGELEHHAPGVKWEQERGVFARSDISQVWCYSGSYAAMTEAGRLLLGVAI